jgi:hypothetical protein
MPLMSNPASSQKKRLAKVAGPQVRQLLNVCFWHNADIPTAVNDVRFRWPLRQDRSQQMASALQCAACAGPAHAPRAAKPRLIQQLL